MSNDSESANMNDRGGSARNEGNRGNDMAQKAGQQSQDASRHQQDASQHKNDKGPQRGGTDDKSGQQSQGGSQKDTGATKQTGSLLSRDTYGTYKNAVPGPEPALMGADTLIGNDVYNTAEQQSVPS